MLSMLFLPSQLNSFMSPLSCCQEGHSSLVPILTSVIPLNVLDQEISAAGFVLQKVLSDLEHVGWTRVERGRMEEGGYCRGLRRAWLGLCRAGAGG